jgi:hypothetical protein
MSAVTIFGTPINLWCLVRGNNKAFYVTIGEDNFIIDLIEIIKKKRKPHFDEFAPDELIL